IAGTTTGPARVAIGDINGDGKLDLVVGIATSGTASRARVYDALTLSEMFGTTLFNYGGGYPGGVFVAALPKAKSGVVTT
ncbi:MAG TPA: VCBS repeat-containing protein, partial [Gemmatales bacterium]|nr:VCBS repeat-containing protein [Gemmatales bacterium]